MPKTILLFFCCLLTLLQGCAYGIYEDKRLLDTMSDDKMLASNIKSALLKNNFSGGMAISVYCYYRHVFLVGEIPTSLQNKAQQIAESKNPQSVTTHWFTKAKSGDSDFMLATRIRTALIGTKGLSSTRVDTEVNAGRVVLLGIIENETERKLAIHATKKVDGVVNVTSYLMQPPSVHSIQDTPSSEEVFDNTTSPSHSGVIERPI